MEVRLELLELFIGKAAESERVGTKRNRVSSVEAASQDSSKDHAGRRQFRFIFDPFTAPSSPVITGSAKTIPLS